jgi:hypothetical protein
MTRELVSDNLTEERVTEFAKRQAGYVAGEAMQQIPTLQEATNMWLRQFRRGHFDVKIDTSDLEPRMQDLRDIAGHDPWGHRRRRPYRLGHRGQYSAC